MNEVKENVLKVATTYILHRNKLIFLFLCYINGSHKATMLIHIIKYLMRILIKDDALNDSD